MLPHSLRVLYLHGFASSPASRKAQFFAARLDSQGIRLEIPALDEGDFEHLTVTRQLRLIERLIEGAPAILIGSSLGGYLAALYASKHPEIHRLILLAPAFDFYHLWLSSLGPEAVASWERKGALPIFHHAHLREVPLDFEFMRDAARCPPFPHFVQPALLFHGNHDAVVPVHHSLLFAAAHPNVRLSRLDPVMSSPTYSVPSGSNREVFWSLAGSLQSDRLKVLNGTGSFLATVIFRVTSNDCIRSGRARWQSRSVS